MKTGLVSLKSFGPISEKIEGFHEIDNFINDNYISGSLVCFL